MLYAGVGRIGEDNKIQIPEFMQKMSSIDKNTSVEIYVDDGIIVLKNNERSKVDKAIDSLKQIVDRLNSDSELDMDINQISKFWSEDIENAIKLLERK